MMGTMNGDALPQRPVVGVLHPGAMGAALGSAVKPRAGVVIWAAAGRSPTTAKRAELADLVAVPDIAALARRSHLVVSICPPHAALAVAAEVARALADRPVAHRPLYLDANAVAPGTVAEIARLLGAERVIDGAVIGPPAYRAGQSVLWLAGPHARAVAALFADGVFGTRVLGERAGAASALKACFALHSKALPALWLQLAEAAGRAGVAAELRAELTRAGVNLDERLRAITERVGSKAWRWAGEMDEAATAMAELGLAEGFSRAAAEVYRHLAGRG
jgi:hypothetical protein